MNWDDLRVVSTIYRTGSFTRAARMLEVNETTIARRIGRIEETLGTPLFIAAAGRREPTEDCLRILEHLAQMERSADAIHSTLTEPHATRRRLRLSTIGAIAEFYLADVVPELLDAEPDLALAIDTSDRNIAMSRWDADFAIRLGRPSRGDFIVRRIGTLQFALVRPRAGMPEPVVAAYPETLSATPEMQALCTRLGALKPRFETSDLGLLRRFLASGRGIGVLPEPLARTLAASPGLEVEALDAGRDVWLLTQPHLREDPLARSVSDWCARQFTAP